MKQITNKDLLYSAGNYSQYLVKLIREKNLKRIWKSIFKYTHTHTHTRMYITFSNILRTNSYHFTQNIEAIWVPVPCPFYVLVALCIEFTYIEDPISVTIFDFIIQT